MLHSQCFWTAVTISNGGLSHQLHWSLLLVGSFLLGSAIALAIQTNWRRQRRLKSKQVLITSITGSIPKPNFEEIKTMPSATISKTLAELWTTCVAHLKSLARHTAQRSERNQRAIAICFAFFVCGILVYAGTQYQDVEERTAVRIETHPTDRQWYIVSNEKPLGEMAYFCDDFSNKDWIYAGYFARSAKWEVKADCFSIKAKGLGFFYDWKADGTAKTNREAGYE